LLRKLCFSLLILSLLAFSIDLFHILYHLASEPALWRMSGVPAKLALKLVSFFIPLLFLISRKAWLSWLVVLLFVIASQGEILAATDCQQAREMLEQSGMARDASEDFFGNIKRKPPYGTFPSDMDRITWWGTFRPFEFWRSPEFKAVWINPQGQEILSQTFRGSHCRLAKTTIFAQAQPRGEFQGGMWKVVVTCEDYLIDRQSFAVTPPPGFSQAPDAQKPSQETAMIWAKDMLDEG
jgi:hypothetical protein